MPLASEYYSAHCPRIFSHLEQNKNITFNFNQDITSVNIEGLKKGAYDLIFGSYSANEPNIEFVPIIKQEIVAILPVGHPLSRKEALRGR
ncbi:MAG: LysR substrate-binding domain-containing protein [Roseburia inulinivorans]